MSGLRKGPTGCSLNIPVIVFMLAQLFIGFFGTIHQLLFVPQDLYRGTEVLMNVSLIGHTLATYLALIWKQPTIINMLTIVESGFDSFSETNFGNSNHRKRAEQNNVVLVLAISAIIFSVHLSFIGVSKVYLFHLPPEDKSLLFPVSVPFAITNFTYYLVYFLEVLITVGEAVVHISSITLCTGFINILCSEFILLGRAFRTLVDKARSQALRCSGTEVGPEWTPAEHLDYHANLLLKSYVKHHILLIGFFKDLQSTFGIPILEMFVNCQIMLCSTGFHIFKLYQLGALQDLFKQFCMFSALVSHEFVYFWFGTKLTEKVESFRVDVWACDWHARCPCFKRSYRIILENIKRSLIIQAVILPTTLATFAKCLQAALSYFNILLVLSYKQDKQQADRPL